MSRVNLIEQPPIVTIDDFLTTYNHPEHRYAQAAKSFLVILLKVIDLIIKGGDSIS